MAKKKDIAAKPARVQAKAQKATAEPHDHPRRVKDAKYRSFRLQPRIKAKKPQLPGAFKIFGQSLAMLKKNWRVFGCLFLVYALVNLVVVQGLTAGHDFSGVKNSLKGLFNGNVASVASGTALFLSVIGSSSQGVSAAAGPYQFIWTVLSSLAVIWLLRQLHAGKAVRARDSYYRGAYPFIPFVLVLIVVALDFVPAIIGGTLFGAAFGGIAITAIEHIVWGAVFGLSIVLSLYFVIPSVFALYIVCLPDMTPMKALRASRQLLLNRRPTVLRKVLFLPLVLIVLISLIMLPLIATLPALASWVFFVLSMAALLVLHSYYYTLYRALLDT